MNVTNESKDFNGTISALGLAVSCCFGMSVMSRRESDIIHLAPVPEQDELSVHETSLRLSLICFPSYLPIPDTSYLSGTAWFVEFLLFTQKQGDQP